ncbi:atrial natriuretic peptide receptor 1 isoform X2 [Hydra vulgaris]|uniref:Guanylate cyclase n=3 Tax=Hydra vulgaris TaxID=6087 RepID=A0ABM4DE40_HYDVU
MTFQLFINVLLVNFVVYYVSSDIIVGMLISFTSNDVNAKTYAGAVSRVVDDINSNDEILNGTKLIYYIADPSCNDRDGLGASVTLFKNYSIDVFIGPPCSESCLSSGLLSSYEKIPMISFGCSSNLLSNKTNYPYFARTKPFARTSSLYTPKTFLQILKYFSWKHVCLIQSDNDIYAPMAQRIYEELTYKGNISVELESYYPNYVDYLSKKNILIGLQNKCRIFIFITSRRDVVDFSVHAWKLGWMKNNEYAFLHLDFDFEFVSWTVDRIAQWGLSRDFVLSSVLEGLIIVSNSRPDESDSKYIQFLNDVAKRLQTDFNISTSAKSVTSTAGYLYDATMLYARAVDAMFKRNSTASIKDAQQIFEFIKNTSFEGITGIVDVDEFGDRIPVFVIDNVHNGTIINLASYDPLLKSSISINKLVYFLGGYTTAPVDIPKCGFDNKGCSVMFKLALVVGCGFGVLAFLIIVLILYLYRKKKYEMKILMKGLVINWNELSFVDMDSIKASVRSRMSLKRRKHNQQKSTYNLQLGRSRTVYLQSTQLFVKTIKNCKLELNKDILIDLKHMKDLNEINVNSFIGVSIRGQDYHLLWSYCSYNLTDVLHNNEITCDWMFRLSFAKDIAQGLQVIHKSLVGVHGHLRSSNCLVDSRWVCKVSNFGLRKFQNFLKDNEFSVERQKNFYDPPEMVQSSVYYASSDIYSYGMILYEIYTRGDLYELELESGFSPRDIIEKIKKNSSFMSLPKILDVDSSYSYINLMKECWKKVPSQRPTTKAILKTIVKMEKKSGINGSIVDHMLTKMEKYTDNLETIVAERTHELEQEKIKTENLLYKMLPRTVANKLKEGHPVVAESFSSVTIFFSDIVGFTSLCSESSPFEVVEMLNDLYVCFDNCIDMYDVYKVETIGDAYMVVSGIPNHNGDKHVEEIATMSLDLLRCVKNFKIRHRPDTQMQLRVGMHTGSCVAGVVGLKMPRYCLFGDTVNYASRMESTGLAMRIHVSPESYKLLFQIGSYHLLKRGPVEMKGKGIIETYFLMGKDGFDNEMPNSIPNSNS